MGIASITGNAAPSPKLRVTCLSCTEALPQWAQLCSTEVDGDDDELTGKANFDDGFSGRAIERDARDDAFDFASLGIALTLRDLAREDDVLATA